MFKDENRHYSLRKLSVGLASVLIGISFASTTGNSVKADTVESGNNSVQTVVKGSDTAVKIGAKDDANVAKSNTESADEASKKDPNAIVQDIKQEATKGDDPEAVTKNATDSSQITAKNTLKGSDSLAVNNNPLKDTVESAKQGSEMPEVLHNNSNETTLNVNGSKAEVKGNQALGDPAKSKLKTATLMTTTGKKFNTKMSFASKVVSPANDTNGGFDSSWGKLNVNDWKGSVQGDYYQLTSYTGDANHVIVPNEADFTKAGISTSGKQVGVTSDLMYDIFRNKTTAQDATVAFSKTDNKQVKAIGTDWHNTWGHKYANDSKGKISKFDGIELDVSNVTNMCYMLDGNQISDLSPLANWNVNNVTNMSNMFSWNKITDLNPLAKWDISNVTNMSDMFSWNKITDLNPLAKWDISNVTNMSSMFYGNRISTLSSLANWNVNNVADMNNMFSNNQISDLSSLAKWDVSNVTNMNNMFSDNQISDLSSLAKWDVSNVTNMSWMFCDNQISDLSSLAKWNVNNVADMNHMFDNNKISDLNPLSSWKTDNVTNMSSMFYTNRINDLSPLASWKTDNVTNMSWMFAYNQISDLSSLSSWKTDNVTDMRCIFDNNATTQTKNLQAKRVINFVYPTDYTGKKQDSIIQTVDVPQKVNVELTTKDSKPSNNILDWVTKTETPEASDPVYFQDYTVPEIKGLLEPNQTVISRQQADITKPINVTVTYRLVDFNTNDTFALDSKNGLHEHKNVNDNGGYDKDYWGTLDASKFTTVKNGDNLEITGYTGDNSKVIIPNITDFEIDNLDQGAKQVTISSDVMHDLAKNATRIGLSKTNNQKVVADDAIWQDAFGGQTNEPNTSSNAYGGMWVYNPNLMTMDLHNLDTTNITDMSAMFNGGRNLNVVGDLSQWNTANVASMRIMFQLASSLTNLGNLNNWDTSKVTDMGYMFNQASSLTNIGDLDNWNTSKVTDMNHMFDEASNLTNIGDLSKWDVSNVTNMSSMFELASSLTNLGNLNNWDTSKVTDMGYMFNQASSLTNIGDLSKWQTGNVTDMYYMFANATNLTNIGNLDNWDTSNVTNMAYMFANAINLTNIGDLSKWNVSKVTNMFGMFGDTNALRHLNISNWNLTKLANKDSMQYMFTEDPNLTVIANDLKLPTWYENEINNADYFWNNHIAVITNVPELIKATGDINNLKIDNQDASRSIFYDSKGSSDAIKVLTDTNNQYIADYHKANPTKFLKLADTVDQNDPIALANASFITVPAAVGLTVHFEDVDPNADKDSDTVKQELVKTVELSGHSGDTADLSQVQLPTNFELSGDLPSATFGNTDSVTIKLKHKLSDEITSKENGVAHARTEVIAPDGTVLIQGGAGVQSFIDQRQDLVTGEMVNGDTHWTYGTSRSINVPSDILNKYIEQYNPAILDTSMNKSTRGWQDTLSGLRQPLQIKLKDGYTVKSIGNWKNWDNNGTYTWEGLKGDPDWNIMKRFDGYDAFQIAPLDQSVHYQFMDNGAQVGSDVIINGKTGETVAPNLSIPENYEVADGTTLPTSYTFAATNPNIQINLKHKTKASVESLPATRTINVHLPNGTTKVYEQIIGYQRDVITDLVTKTVTRGTWTVNDVTSSFTIDGVKQLEHSYVLRNGNYNFAGIKLPKVPGYKAGIKTVPNLVNPASSLFTVSFIALPKPVTLAPNDVEPAKTIASATTETADLIKTDSKATISVTPKTIDLSDDVVTTTPNVIDLSNDAVTAIPKETTWHVANELDQDIYRVSNGKYTVELPHISNAQLHVLANNSTKDSVLFTYKGQNTKYVFNIKFVNGYYLLTTYEIKSGKLVKLIDYNFIKSSKVSDLILDWLKR